MIACGAPVEVHRALRHTSFFAVYVAVRHFFSNAIPWGGGFLGDALNWFNGGRGELGDFGRFWDKIWGKFKNN